MADSRGGSKTFFAVANYDLGATLDSGQAFRWRSQPEGWWIGIVGKRNVRLRSLPGGIAAETAAPVDDWGWLIQYLQLEVDLDQVIRTFPNDAPMRTAVKQCTGLRLLRQDPWECLASFILSSTKQIVQIKQIVERVSECFGETIPSLTSGAPVHAFPTVESLAESSEADLRGCRMGFRAKYLGATAKRISSGAFDLKRIGTLPLEEAREELIKLPGVGRKIADCVLLFAYGFPKAFPVDVWVLRALNLLYFPRRRRRLKFLQTFSQHHFGPYAGYAQQYLFHYMRTKVPRGQVPVLNEN